MTKVHPTAIVEDGARIGADVSIGAFSIVGREVTVEDGVAIDAHAILRGRTTVGTRTRIGPFAAIGGEPQDVSYKGEDAGIAIGPDCIIREYVTIHRGTAKGRGMTTVGARCFLMIGSHVAHDCIVGDNVVLTNHATLGGHTDVGEHAILGGLAAVQQSTRVGAHAFVAGLTGVTRDIVPFVMVTGYRDSLGGINVIGLKRRGFDRDTIHALRAAYDAFFFTSGPRAERIARLSERFGGVAAVRKFVDFLRATGDRPLSLPRRRRAEEKALDSA